MTQRAVPERLLNGWADALAPAVAKHYRGQPEHAILFGGAVAAALNETDENGERSKIPSEVLCHPDFNAILHGTVSVVLSETSGE